MNFHDEFEKNQCTLTGVILETKQFAHRDNLVTLRLSARSYGKSFYADVRESKREHIMIELHDTAAAKVLRYNRGDVLCIEGHLSTRKWEDGRGIEQNRVVLVAERAHQVSKLRESRQAEDPSARQEAD